MLKVIVTRRVIREGHPQNSNGAPACPAGLVGGLGRGRVTGWQRRERVEGLQVAEAHTGMGQAALLQMSSDSLCTCQSRASCQHLL